MAIDGKGTILAFTRAEPPVIELNADGEFVRTWGKGLFDNPHHLRIDHEGNIWIADFQARLHIGEPEVHAGGQGTDVARHAAARARAGDAFNMPTDWPSRPSATSSSATATAIAASCTSRRTASSSRRSARRDRAGPIRVAARHRDGFQGHLFVADRTNSRIQLFDQDGKFLDQWDQFGGTAEPSILKDDTLYSVDTYKFKAVLIGSAKTGHVTSTFTNLSIARGWPSIPGRGRFTPARCGPTRSATWPRDRPCASWSDRPRRASASRAGPTPRHTARRHDSDAPASVAVGR